MSCVAHNDYVNEDLVTEITWPILPSPRPNTWLE